jgi:CheY-like chemotaxis protein
VVDDEPDIRAVLAEIVRGQGFEVAEADNGADAVRLVGEKKPDLIFLDVMMPKMTGLEALAHIREVDPRVCVVVVSGTPEPEHLEEALRLGAVNFLHKPFDREEVAFVVRRLRAAVDEEADVLPVFDLLQERKTVLALGNDPAEVSRVVAFLGRELRLHYPAHEVPAAEIKLALYEAIANAVEHGNLEITYEDKTRAAGTRGGAAGLIEGRRQKAPYKDRRVHVEARYGRDDVEYRIRDEGPGIPAKERDRRPDVTALHGRGLMLIRHYMERVVWNDAGNEIVLGRRFPPRGAAETRPSPCA